MLETLVLAGGGSTRMGSPKALLATPSGETFLTRIVHTLREAGLDRLTVVTGVHHDRIIESCAASGWDAIRFVRNPDPARGQLSSLLSGMHSVVGPETEGVLVMLVDIPLVTVQTVRSVIETWHLTRAPIVRPAVGSAHGHPVIFDVETFAALRAAPLELGAKSVISALGDRVQNVEVPDRGCLVDIDTPDEYVRLVSQPD
jgi:molybdenum cofactor cytidylyltransferase